MKKIVTITVVCLILIFIIAIKVFIKPISEYALHRAGFNRARIESVSLGLSGTTLTNITLDDANSIGTVGLYATLDDILGSRFGKITISGARLKLPFGSAGGAAGALNLFTREMEIADLTVITPTPYGDLPLQISGTVNDEGDHYLVNADFSGAADFATVAGAMKITIDKATRKADVHVDIADSKAAVPDIDIKRAAGWIEATIDPAESLPAVNAQLSFGAVKAYGLPLQGMTLTASSEPAKTQILLNGQVANDSGDIAVDFKLDRAETDNVTVHAESKLKNLDALEIDKLKGRGNAVVNFAAEKDRTAAYDDVASWRGIAGDVAVDADKLSLPGLVSGAIANVKADIGYDPALRKVTLKTADSSVSTAAFSAKGVSADLALYMQENPVAEGKLTFGEIAQIANKPYIIPVKLALTFTPLSSAQFTTGISGEVTEKNGLLYAKINGRHDAAAQKGKINIEMPPVNMIAGVHNLAEIFPSSVEYITDATGTFGLTADLGWEKKEDKWRTSSSGSVILKNMNASVKENAFKDVNAVVKLASLSPLTFSHQSVAVGAFNAGLPLTNGVVEASFDAKGIFTLHRAEWELAKGKITSTPFSLSFANITADATLTAEKLDLPELFKIAPMEGLDATGIVNGTLPLKIKDGNIALADGVLETEGPGVVRYNPQVVPAFLQSKEKSIMDLRVALKAFEFESLKMTLNGEIGKTQKIGLHIKGKNPEFYGGHPVSLNLNVEGPLENVLRYSPGSSRIPDSIKKQMEEYEKQHGK